MLQLGADFIFLAQHFFIDRLAPVIRLQGLEDIIPTLEAETVENEYSVLRTTEQLQFLPRGKGVIFFKKA